MANSSRLTFMCVLFILTTSNLVVSQSLVRTLPGFLGDLPFVLETGYIGVGERDEVQLFYYFIESERKPENDPLLLWLTGGPGCSGLSGLLYEIGPVAFDYEKSKGSRPRLKLNPYAWTKVANIIYLDSEAGTGFSYANSSDGYRTGDLLSSAHSYQFLKKWLMAHPRFLFNALYIAGDSYSGITIPIIVQEISNGNEIGNDPPLNIQGFMLGNPFTDDRYDENSRVVYAHRMALLSDQLYEATKEDCKGEYTHPDPSNAACISDLQVVTDCLVRINYPQILEPKCNFSPRQTTSGWKSSSLLGEDSIDVLLSTSKHPETWCRNMNYLLSYVWANDETVQNALHVREGTIKEWVRCNASLASDYTHDVISSIEYQRNFTTSGYHALIYSGDHDMVIPHVGTQEWIETLNLTTSIEWQPWFIDGQIAGYATVYEEKRYSLTFATVKGAGHRAPQYKPKQCLAMVDRWFAYYPL